MTDTTHAAVKRRTASLSIAVNVLLLGMKAVVGVLTGSVALWASAADSLLDLSASTFAYVGVRIGSRPPDDTHPYGHEKFESLSSLVQLGLLFVTVGVIAAEAWDRIRGEPSIETPAYGIAVIVVSLAVDVWISRRLRRVARVTGSQALEADALHFSTDVWSNVAVLVGLAAVALGFPLGDPLAAFVVAFLVAATAFELLRDTAGVLTDAAPQEEVVRELEDALRRFPEVHDLHTLRARLVGSRIFLDVCVELDPELSFQRAHDLSHEMQDALRGAVPEVADAVIHFEPAGHPRAQDAAHHAHGFDALTRATADDEDDHADR